MSDPITPSTAEVRADYIRDHTRNFDSYMVGRSLTSEQEFYSKKFDRWLAAHDAEKRAEWEAEQGYKHAPCVMTHTPPFDFAQCETHDETFPLGGACKWHGKESVAQVLQDEADEQRRRAVRAEHQLEILRAEQGETEWEYGYELIEPDTRDVFERDGHYISTAFAYRAAKMRIHEERHPGVPGLQYSLIQRTKAGPWLPVPGSTVRESDSGVRDSDSEESEGKA